MADLICPIEGSTSYFDTMRVNNNTLLDALLKEPPFLDVTDTEDFLDELEEFANWGGWAEDSPLVKLLKKGKYSYSIFELSTDTGQGSGTFYYASSDGDLFEEFNSRNATTKLNKCTGKFAKYKELTKIDEDYMDRIADQIDKNIDCGFYDWINNEDNLKNNELDFLSEEKKTLTKLQIELIHEIRDLAYDGNNHNHCDIVIERND